MREVKKQRTTDLLVLSDYRIADEEIVRISKLHLQGLYKQANRIKAIQKYKIQDLARKSQVLAVLTIKCAILKGKSLTDIKTEKNAREVIEDMMGITDMRTWLDSRGEEKDAILSTSGRKGIIQSYMQLNILSKENESLLKNAARFRDRISELLRWLRIVATLNKHALENRKIAKLALLVGSIEKTWNQQRVYLTVILGTILDKNIIMFQIKDLIELVKRLRENLWEEPVLEALRSITIEGTNETFADDPIILEIIRTLRNPENQALFYFLKKVPFELERERKMLEDGYLIMQDAMMAVVDQENNDPNREITGDTPAFRKKITNVLANKKPHIAEMYLMQHPYLAAWLLDEELFRITWFSKKISLLKDAIRHYDTESRIDLMQKKLALKVTVKTVVDNIFTGDYLFDIPYEFFVKNRAFFRNNEISAEARENPRTPSLSATLEHSMTKTLLEYTISTLQPWYFSKWLTSVRETNIIPVIKNLSKRKLIAAHFSTVPEDRSETLNTIVNEYEWLPYIDDLSLEYFKRIAGRRIRSKIEIKNQIPDETPSEELV